MARPETRARFDRAAIPRAYDTARDARDLALLTAGAFDRLLAPYYPVILNRARLRGLSEEDAWDVTQTVLERLCQDLKSGKGHVLAAERGLPFRAMVHMRTKWTLLEHAKDAARQRATQQSEDEEVVGEGGIDPYDSDSGVDLPHVLSTLTSHQRNVVELRWGMGMSPEEIGRRLGKNRNAVDQTLHRALLKLRRMLTTGETDD